MKYEKLTMFKIVIKSTPVSICAQNKCLTSLCTIFSSYPSKYLEKTVDEVYLIFYFVSRDCKDEGKNGQYKVCVCSRKGSLLLLNICKEYLYATDLSTRFEMGVQEP